MGPTRRISVILIAASFLASGAFAGVNSATRGQIAKDLMSRKLVAKVDLYQAHVYEGGQVESETDDEAIRIGFPINIESVTFSGSKIRVRMKHPHLNDVTYVDFLFNKPLSADFGAEREEFERMLGLVFEEKKGDE